MTFSSTCYITCCGQTACCIERYAGLLLTMTFTLQSEKARGLLDTVPVSCVSSKLSLQTVMQASCFANKKCLENMTSLLSRLESARRETEQRFSSVSPRHRIRRGFVC